MNFKADVATKETVINDPMMTCTTTPRSFTSRTNASAINKAQPQANPFPAISIVSSAANFAILSPMPMLEKSATASPSGRSIRHNEVSTSCHGGVASTSWITDINLPFWMAKLPHEGTLPAVCGWQVPGAKTSEQDHQRLSADSQFCRFSSCFHQNFLMNIMNVQLKLHCSSVFFGGLFWRETKICHYPSVSDTATGGHFGPAALPQEWNGFLAGLNLWLPCFHTHYQQGSL